jgi:hypothetical protein
LPKSADLSQNPTEGETHYGETEEYYGNCLDGCRSHAGKYFPSQQRQYVAQV